MAKIQFYPTDITYKVREGRPVIFIFGRDTDGRTVCLTDDTFKPYFWVMLKDDADADSFRKETEMMREESKTGPLRVEATETAKRNYLGEEKELVRVFVNQPSAVPRFRDILRERGDVSLVLEADIHYVRRYLIDRRITPAALHEAEGEESRENVRCDYVMKAGRIEQIGEDTIKPKVISIDIETYNPEGRNMDYYKHPIVMMALYGDGVEKVLTWKKFRTEHDYIEFVDGEADLLKRFKEILDRHRPDMLVGYYSDGFDLPYLKARAEKHKVNLNIGMDYTGIKLSRGRNQNAEITGMTHIDVFRFIKFIMGGSLDTDYFDLDSVAEELLGENKKDVDLNTLAEVWDNDNNRIEPFCEYNLHDAVITHRLCERILPNILELVKIVALPLFDATRMSFSQLVEWYLMRQAPSYNVIAPNKPGHGEISGRIGRSYQGAFVFEPKPGMYRDIAVFDFRSLYPTIISAHNISPETLNRDCSEEERDYAPLEDKEEKNKEYEDKKEKSKEEKNSKNIWFCKSRKGFLPKMIGELITRRMRIKEIMKTKEDKMLEARSYSLKILANAFYGYMGFYASRWYSYECANAVTAWGRHYIHKVIKKAEDSGFRVLYSDTDSVFLSLEGDKKDNALRFVEKINMDLPELMELEFEGFYPVGIFVSAKLTGYGAKKKYALLDEKGGITIKGFETVRRNWSLIAKETQEKVIEIILRENDIEKAMDYVQDIVKRLKNNEISTENVVIHTQLQKEISSYEQHGPHVVVAQRMQKKGLPVMPGMMVEYVITSGKEKISERARLPSEVGRNDYDPDYYINNQVIPAVERIFQVLGEDIKGAVEAKGQSKLQKFFGS
ncbi:MAG: DNA-directed DNA polymerase [Candidatus Woesearchaeota archaeon]